MVIATLSLIQLSNSNCPWCLNNMVDRLQAHPAVRGVRLDAATGCLRVDHDCSDIADLMAGIRGNLRAPAMVAVGIAWLIVGRAGEGIYTAQLRSKAGSPASRLCSGLLLLATLSFSQRRRAAPGT
ncbi:MAG: hypothetical protein ACRDZX_01060 [Acidimicrobiales bacterium]